MHRYGIWHMCDIRRPDPNAPDPEQYIQNAIVSDAQSKNPLIAAILRKDDEEVIRLAEVDGGYWLSRPSENFSLPMCAAVCVNSRKYVELLIEKKAPLEEDGQLILPTPLHLAVARKYYDLAEILLNLGVTVCAFHMAARTNVKPCPWRVAMDDEDIELVKLLIKYLNRDNKRLCHHFLASPIRAIGKRFYAAIPYILETKLIDFDHEGHNLLDFVAGASVRFDKEDQFFECVSHLLRAGVDIHCQKNPGYYKNICFLYLVSLRHMLSSLKMVDHSPGDYIPDCHTLCKLPAMPPPQHFQEQIASIMFSVGLVPAWSYFKDLGALALFCRGTPFTKWMVHSVLHVQPLQRLCRKALRLYCGMYPYDKLMAYENHAPKPLLDYLTMKDIHKVNK